MTSISGGGRHDIWQQCVLCWLTDFVICSCHGRHQRASRHQPSAELAACWVSSYWAVSACLGKPWPQAWVKDFVGSKMFFSGAVTTCSLEEAQAGIWEPLAGKSAQNLKCHSMLLTHSGLTFSVQCRCTSGELSVHLDVSAP